MADNKEFIAAKDLPATEAKEVDVLCVEPETGELVRKPGASLGGGAEEYDMLIRFSVAGGGIHDNFARFEYGTPQAIIEKLRNGEIPKIVIAGSFEYCTISYINRSVKSSNIDSDSYSIDLDVINDYTDTLGYYLTITLANETSYLYENYGDGWGISETLQIETAS